VDRAGKLTITEITALGADGSGGGGRDGGVPWLPAEIDDEATPLMVPPMDWRVVTVVMAVIIAALFLGGLDAYVLSGRMGPGRDRRDIWEDEEEEEEGGSSIEF
jgi:hypothetical protein